MPPARIQGLRLPKREWQLSERTPNRMFAMRAKTMLTEFMVVRITSGWPIPSVVKRCGSSTDEAIWHGMTHMNPYTM